MRQNKGICDILDVAIKSILFLNTNLVPYIYRKIKILSVFKIFVVTIYNLVPAIDKSRIEKKRLLSFSDRFNICIR